jgi:hypothetical protein
MNAKSGTKTFLYRTFAVFMIALLALTALPVNSAFARPMAAVAQRGTATTATTIGTSLVFAGLPSGVVAGDVMIVNIAQRGDDTTNPTSSGWTLIQGAALRSAAGSTNDYRGAVLYKVAGASETAPTFTLGASVTNAVGAIVAFSGVDTSGATPFDVAPVAILANTTGATAVGATSITTASANAPVIMFGMAASNPAAWSGWTTTSPGALTELYDTPTTSASVGAAWATKASAGSTGAGAATISVSSPNGGILIALKPDTTPPTVTFDLQSASDSGTSNTDNLTNVASPVFDAIFSEAVTGFALGDLSNAGTATSYRFLLL